MNSMKTRLLLLVLLVVGSFFGCSNKPRTRAASPETVRNISVLAVREANIPDLLEAVGTVRAAQTSELSSQMVGNIVEVRAREGDRVRRGQVLAVIDESQPRAAFDRATAVDLAAQEQLVAADSDSNLADATLKRYQSLYERRSVSPQEFDEVKARQQSARARRDMAKARQEQSKAAVAEARAGLDYTRIRAPFDGVVTERRADPGTLASPGMPIFTVEDVRCYRLEVAVNESDLRYLKNGGTVPITVDAIGDAGIKGKVVQIVPAASPASRSFLVKIELPPHARLRSGFYGRARFARGNRPALLIPRSAVVERGQLQGVFVLDQNRIASLRYITMGKPSGDSMEVLAGLQGGERVVASPGELDLNGKRVEGE